MFKIIYITFLFIFIFFSCGKNEIKDFSSADAEVVVINDNKILDSVLIALESKPLDLYLNVGLWDYYIEKNAADTIILKTLSLLEKIDNQDSLEVNSKLKYYTLGYLSWGYLNLNNFESADYYVKIAIKLGESFEKKDLRFFGRLYNIYAITNLKLRLDYRTALEGYNKALKTVEQIGDTANQSVVLGNITSIYELRRDTSGLEYAMKAYKLGKFIDNSNLKNRNCLQLATQYYLRKDYEKALSLINEAISLSEAISLPKWNKPDKEDAFHINSLYFHLIYGNILQEKGEFTQAEKLYEKAMKSLTPVSDGIDIMLSHSYGDLLYQTGRYEKALSIYKIGIEAANKTNSIQNIKPIFLGLSQTYEKLGNNKLAFKYYKEYDSAKSDFFNMKNERSFNQLQLQYEKTKHNERLQEKEIALMESEQKLAVVILIFILIGILSIYQYIIHKKNKAMYSNLVLRYSNFKQRFDSLKQIEEAKKNSNNAANISLYEELENLMNKEKIFRNKDFCSTMAARMLNTNITYISTMINEYAGMSFPNYLNSYRINEAISMLSSSEGGDLFKSISDIVGYTSFSTFYRAFVKETGCSPSKYREEILKIKKANQK